MAASALSRLIQAGLLFPDTHDFVGRWLVMMLFGTIYAVIGGEITIRFERRRRPAKIE